MASLPLAGVKPCPRRWLIRTEERRRGGAADSQNGGRGERRGSLPLRKKRGTVKVFNNKGCSDSMEDIISWCEMIMSPKGQLP